MQSVSTEYKNSMKSTIRGCGYIKISVGKWNENAQKNATVGTGDYAYFSNGNIFNDADTVKDYATLEGYFTKIDGSMYFAPRDPADTNVLGKMLLGSGMLE